MAHYDLNFTWEAFFAAFLLLNEFSADVELLVVLIMSVYFPLFNQHNFLKPGCFFWKGYRVLLICIAPWLMLNLYSNLAVKDNIPSRVILNIFCSVIAQTLMFLFFQVVSGLVQYWDELMGQRLGFSGNNDLLRSMEIRVHTDFWWVLPALVNTVQPGMLGVFSSDKVNC